MPRVSIIIRTFNEEKHLGNLLRAIKEQNYQDYEIILVDSGSTDRTLEIARANCDRIIQIQSRDFTFGYSLNVGCRQSQGDYFVIISAHATPIDAHWLTNIIAPFENEQVAMVYGRHIGAQETKYSEKRDFEKYFGTLEDNKHPLPHFANNANSAIRARVWQSHHFNEYLTGLEDLDWSRWAQEQGFKVKYAPGAAVYHIHQESWPQVYNRYRREAIAARKLGIARPPFATHHLKTFARNIISDVGASRNDFSLARLKEIAHFRYHQWRGTRQGWKKDGQIDIDKEHGALYYSGANQGVMISGPNQAILKDLPIPEVKPGDVLIKVAYVGVCGTDLEVYDGSLGYYQRGLASYPIVPGHEFSGEVSAVGANVSDFAVGDRVVGECILSCGSCARCKNDSHIACAARKEVGVMNYHGAYANFIVLPDKHVHKIPEQLDLKTACLAEPLAVVLRALRRVENRMKSASHCAVIGAGPIGNLAAQVLNNQGQQVTVFNRSKFRLDFLNKNIITEQAIHNLEQYDLIVEASGNVQALEDVLSKSRTDATIVLLGFPYGNITYNFEDLVGHEKVILGSVGGANQDFKRALEILPKLDTVEFTKTVLPLSEFAKGWDLHRSKEQVKVLFKVCPVVKL